MAEFKDLTKEALQYLVDTGVALERAKEIARFEKNPNDPNGPGYMIYGGSVKFTEPHDEPLPPELCVASLAGLVEFIKADTDNLIGANDVMIRVESPLDVQLYGPLHGYQKKRPQLAYARAMVPHIPFGRFLTPDEFNVMLQTSFVESETRDSVLSFAGIVKIDAGMTTADDGFSQRVSVSKSAGGCGLTSANIRNPFILAPRRTFAEIEQPMSPFILRFNEEGNIALFEGDGGAWQYAAIMEIKRHLNYEIHGYAYGEDPGRYPNIHVIA